MGLRELGRIPAPTRSDSGSMPWARQRTPETFRLDVQSKHGHLEICLPLGRTYLVVAVSIGM